MERRARNRRIAWAQLLLTAAVLVALNVLGSTVFHRFDLTAGKRFSISEPTRELLRDLDDIVTVTVYLDGDLTPNLARLQAETLELLGRFKAEAGSNFEFTVFDPHAIAARDNRETFIHDLGDRGMTPVEFRAAQGGTQTLSTYFPYAEVRYRDGDPLPVLLLENNFFNRADFLWPECDPSEAVSLLEHDFAAAVRTAVRPVGPRIAFVTGQGELDSLQVRDAAYTLSAYYRVERFDLNYVHAIDTGIRLLVLAHSRTPFSRVNQFKLDQYLMRGGRLLWFLDGLNASFDSVVAGEGEYFTRPWTREIESQLFGYGARLNEDLVQDKQCTPLAVPSGESGRMAYHPWPYRPIVTHVHPRHPITRYLDAVEMRFASTVDTVAVKGVRKTVLLRTSANSRRLPDPVRVRFNTAVNPPPDELFDESGLPLAVLLEGRFPSAFRPRRLLAEEFISRGVGGDAFLERGEPSRMIVVGDGDLIRNEVAPDGRIAPLGMNFVMSYLFANKDFVLNCVEYLVDDSGLMVTRAREIRLRPLDEARVEAQLGRWQFVCIAAPLLILFLLGGVYNLVRYLRYGRAPDPSPRTANEAGGGGANEMS